MKQLKYDYVIGNPPYNASGIVDKHLHKEYYEALGSGGKHGSLAFIMKAVDRLKRGGTLIYIIPTNGMVLINSIGFRKYVSATSSITNLWITNKDVFRNKITNKLEACIQGNTFIIRIDKNKNIPCEVNTEYTNGNIFSTVTNYSEYKSKYFPLVLSTILEKCLLKNIAHDGDTSLTDIMVKGAMHNNIARDNVFPDKENHPYKVMLKLNRGKNIVYGWTDIDEGSIRDTWRVVFSPICKVKEIMQYGKISSSIIEPGISIQANYSYFVANSQEEAMFITKYLEHPLIVMSTIQLFDNAYINDSNLGRLALPEFKCDIENFDDYIWNYFNILDNDRDHVTTIYNDIVNSEKLLMRSTSEDGNKHTE